MKLTTFSGLVLVVFLYTGFAAAKAWSEDACVKIATVDINTVLNNLPESKTKKKEIDELTASAKSKIQAKVDLLQGLEKKVKDKSLPEDSEEVQKLRRETRDFERFQKDTQEELQRHFLKVNRELTEKTVKAIEAYAKAHQLDLVLDKAKDRGPILFGSTAIDITEEVAEELK